MMRGVAFVLTLTALAGCASLEPEPCTPEWVDWQTDRILDPFELPKFVIIEACVPSNLGRIGPHIRSVFIQQTNANDIPLGIKSLGNKATNCVRSGVIKAMLVFHRELRPNSLMAVKRGHCPSFVVPLCYRPLATVCVIVRV